MRWGNVIETQDEREWFEEYVRLALSTPAPKLPPNAQRVGVCDVTWFETEPGLAFIKPTGGSLDDRRLAMLVVREQLAGHGIHQAEFSFDNRYADEVFRKHATWEDVEAKAKRLIQSGQVQVNRKTYDTIAGTVQGDHGTYNVEIHMKDPESQAITYWECECPWNQYAWQRTRQWKKYEGRTCSHALALYWAAKQVPLDEDVHPSGQQSLFGMPFTPTGRPQRGAPMPAPAPQGQQLPLPGMMPGTAQGTPPQMGGPMPPGAPPTPPSAIPPNPYDPANMAPVANPASVPGLKQPSPTNPVQYPGGTFSKVADWDLSGGWEFDSDSATMVTVAAKPTGFENGAIVQTKEEDWGVWVGKSEAHGAGSPAKIPMNSQGEVLGQDPTTGMVQVLFMGKLTDAKGKLEPYGATAWYFPSQLIQRPDVQPPGPNIRRRR